MSGRKITIGLLVVSMLAGSSALAHGGPGRGWEPGPPPPHARWEDRGPGPGRHGGPHGHKAHRPPPPPVQVIEVPVYRYYQRGDRLPDYYRSRNYVIDDWHGYGLHRPPRGYHWVQIGGEYVLAAIATGIVLQVLMGN